MSLFSRRIFFWIKHLYFAYAFLTRLPTHRQAPLPAYTAQALWAFVPVGLLIGGLTASLGGLTLYAGFSERLAAWAMVAMAAIITGALHEDGLADILDGFFGGHDKESRLKIIKKHDIGVFAVLGLLVVKACEAELIVLLLHSDMWAALSAIAILHAVTRGLWGLALRLAPTIRTGPKSLAHDLGIPSYACLAVTSLEVLALLFWLGGGKVTLGIFGGLVILLLFWLHLCRRKIGGINGDSLGALQQLAFITALGLYKVLA